MLFVNPTIQVPEMDIPTLAEDADPNPKVLVEPWTTSSTAMDEMDVAFDVDGPRFYLPSTLEVGQLQQHQMAAFVGAADELVPSGLGKVPAARDKGVYLLEVATESTPTQSELRGSSTSIIKKRTRVQFSKDGTASDVHNLLCGAFPDLQHQK